MTHDVDLTIAGSGAEAGRDILRSVSRAKGQVLGRLKALVRTFVQTATYDPVQRRRNRIKITGEFRRVCIQDRRHCVDRCVTAKGLLSRQHLK